MENNSSFAKIEWVHAQLEWLIRQHQLFILKHDPLQATLTPLAAYFAPPLLGTSRGACFGDFDPCLAGPLF